MAIARRIPVTPWSSTGSRWRTGPLSFGVLLLGLFGFGIGEAVVIGARLGNAPWTVLAEGMSRHTPFSIGGSTFVISLALLMLWVPLQERPGLGTLSNAVVIAVAIDLGLRLVPRPSAVPWQLVQVIGGTVLVALSGALYLTANLGPGPRDGLMTGLHHRFDWPVAPVRLALEFGALAAGFVLGGKVGLGTVVFAFGVGPVLAWWLSRLPQRQDVGPIKIP